MQLAVLAIYLLAALAPWLCSKHREQTSRILALLPAGLTLWFASHLPEIIAGGKVIQPYAWIPGLDISLTFVLDGLSLLFALLICGIGTFILLYAGSYLKGHHHLQRFYVVLLAFMGSMLGLVLSDNLITLFVFWELTSITSYLLIGFNHQDDKTRKAALQGLIVTVAGGLALLAGLILVAIAAGSYSIQEILGQADVLRDYPFYNAMLICLLLGAFTKSAQFPFHFWLPNAMAAPTPVSAYLHSATMVKAGIYLLARLSPELSGTELWILLLTSAGTLTLFTGALLAIRSTDMKKMLAYSTVMALGTLTLLLGLSTELALLAFSAYLLSHSLYKGALFMLAGILDHEAGSRDLRELAGLRRLLPVTALCTALAALSLAGLPPLLGFIGKELFLDALLQGPAAAWMLALVMLSAISGVGIALLIALRPFTGELRAPKPVEAIHEAPKDMLAGPVVLVAASLLLGLAPGLVEGLVLASSSAVLGAEQTGYLSLWHGFNLPLLLSFVSLVLGLVLFRFWGRVRYHLSKLNPLFARGPEAGYFALMQGLVDLASWQTAFLQNGSMRNYLRVLLLSFAGLTAYTLLSRYQLHWNWEVSLYLHELILALILLSAAVAACITASRLGAVAAMGAVGYSVALVFVLFSAPDLAITQILVETLTVLLLVLVLFRLPSFTRLSTPAERGRDALVAILCGGLMTLLIMITIDVQLFPPISDYMIEQSQPLAYGRNIVNVILVDFRALDTLGEIFVLALAALGVYAMIKFRPETAPGANHSAGTLILPPKVRKSETSDATLSDSPSQEKSP
ncbi:putative monovalent cation/H+ antiporter subunit A [Nitrincola tapanii]|uniref:Putative monovalent cation/H+ antiporter subunit A n=1 Tax=Nitrincola tapanii TaxID=1708751 RepID=A0A5A9W297_9GAMM|nr:putative monovalent cation/H+ antiporter subunit A [Nitrincola tapanii]KAA0874215.1 putative monovalent cation/H+ antiporter subunit A [Nitrincola tapanii]